eukprot:maker-scaffold_5-snap-gene-5.54-mRNA-1 protein AED:0.15 eAED:0.15 QI:296/1/1/1/1/1/2/198/383
MFIKEYKKQQFNLAVWPKAKLMRNFLRKVSKVQEINKFSYRALSTERNMKNLTISVISNQKHPVNKLINYQTPTSIAGAEVSFIPYNDSQDEKNPVVLYVPPAPVSTLKSALVNMKPNWLHCFFAGIDAIAPVLQETNFHAKTNEEFKISNGRSAFSESLAEWALMGIMYFNKQIGRLNQNKQAQQYSRFTMDTLDDKKIGFLGYGEIGKTTHRFLKRTLKRKNPEFYALKRRKEEVNGLKVLTTEKEEEVKEFFQDLDYIICSLPGTAATKHFINSERLGYFKSSAVFISIGRGIVVDEEVLAEALKNNRIKGAALDVFEVEPLHKSSPFWELDNVLLSPHNADLTEDYCQLGFNVFMKNLEVYIKSDGKHLDTLVDKSEGY